MSLENGMAEDWSATPWDIERLSQVPATYPATGHEAEGVESLFYEGLPYRGKPTRVFAYLGMPQRKNNEKVPAVVLVHGGGGTAFAYWVRLWNSRGYAAIAMDNYGGIPDPQSADAGTAEKIEPSKTHEFSGPTKFEVTNENGPHDQWVYHAVANVILAHTLLRSRPEVDSERIGLTGISWGGFLTCIVAGNDPRFKLAAPVYGCGFIEDCVWKDMFEAAGAEKAQEWNALWDPSQYIGRAKMPFLWINGTNDSAYYLPSWQKSYQLLPATQRTLTTLVRMPHSHFPGVYSKEVHAFIESHLNGKEPLAEIKNQSREANKVVVEYQSVRPIVKAELNYTTETGPWEKREWKTLPATIENDKKHVTAQLPEAAKAYYVNLVCDRGLTVSTEHLELK